MEDQEKLVGPEPGEPKRLQTDEEPDAKTLSDVHKMNKERPAETNPIPTDIVSKYASKIGDVWWYAKGRNGPGGDPAIGIEIDGIRKTFSGYVWNEWWYFQKVVHKSDDENIPDQCYWYRKMKVPDPSNPEDYETVEEYVGVKLKDLDTGLPIDVPLEIQHDAKTLCSGD